MYVNPLSQETTRHAAFLSPIFTGYKPTPTPTPTPTPPPTDVVGCFKDKRERDLVYRAPNSNVMTNQLCVNLCKQKVSIMPHAIAYNMLLVHSICYDGSCSRCQQSTVINTGILDSTICCQRAVKMKWHPSYLLLCIAIFQMYFSRVARLLPYQLNATTIPIENAPSNRVSSISCRQEAFSAKSQAR